MHRILNSLNLFLSRDSASPDTKYKSDGDALSPLDESAQLKSMHNVRLVTAKSLIDICTPSHDVDWGSVLQMSMSLYGRSLCALILFVPREPLWHTSSRSCKLFRLFLDFSETRDANCWRVDCLSSSENSEKRELQEVMRNDETLSIGDVYITRHSNLRDVQIVFHLVIDDQLLTSDISSRHPCLNGIRNIIRLSSRLGVTSIHIPLLLIEQASESTTVAWCIRRAEMVYKCVKGYLMEVCAMCGGSAAGCPSLLVPHYNVHFVLPSGLAPTVYQQISAMFPTIFQVVPSVSSGT
uniref:Macro domain-containing protein n=1 Tax=Heterorhabditis bacteriophora TaxID=37862 RepID=A0A1I7XND2_HETBA